MARVRHFEIHASDPETSMAFYTALFGWSFEKYGDMPYWVASTGDGEGIDGALMQRQGPAPEKGAPVMGATITVYVDDLDTVLAQAANENIPEALPKFTVPGYGYGGYLMDPDNNVVGLFQPDQEAK